MILAAYHGEITERTMYCYLFGNGENGKNRLYSLEEALRLLSNVTAIYREQNRQTSRGRGHST